MHNSPKKEKSEVLVLPKIEEKGFIEGFIDKLKHVDSKYLQPRRHLMDEKALRY